MTANFAWTNPLTTPPTKAPRIGELVPLGHAVINVKVKAQTTMPDTPNGFGADLEVMADQGDLDTTALDGDQGQPGQISFQVRQIVDPAMSEPALLPPLTNTPQDIGRYYIIQERDDQGLIVAQYAYVWYGSAYRKLMMGAKGPPGPVPNITPEVVTIPPEAQSYVETFGPRLDPDWLFHVASPAGPSGASQPVYLFPDVKEDPAAVVDGDLMMFSGEYTEGGMAIWGPKGIGAQLPRTYSMAEDHFTAWPPPGGFPIGITQQAPIGSFQIEPQPFPWTPVVWGHIGEAGINLSAAPFTVGCQVLLGDQTDGIQIGRGIGTAMAVVNIYPHYSTAADKNRVMSPNNGYAIVPANHTDPAQGTVYVNLWNDGYYGLYDFKPGGAQLFIQVMPMEQPVVHTPITRRNP